MLKDLLATMTFRPRNGNADGYLFDLDGSERFTRPKTGMDIFPIQDNATNFAKLGSMPATLPLFDSFVYAQGYAKSPFGPIMSPVPDNLQWQITIPGMTKGLATAGT